MTTTPDNLPAEVHCRVCHRDITRDMYLSHYKLCQGFISKCETHPLCIRGQLGHQ